MLSYARSGGTLLNRCLAILPNVVMLSEINAEAICPSSCGTIKDQMSKWYNLDLKSDGFIENINEIYEYCVTQELSLIIRDWTFGSFVPSRYNSFKPSKSFATLDLIVKKFPVRFFAFVRNPIDVWLSFEASPRTFYDKNLDFFYEFAQNLINRKVKFFKYEDFCLNPVREMKRICAYIDVDYSDIFLNYMDFKNVTGDTDSLNCSRGVEQGFIKLLPRRKSFQFFTDEINSKTKANKINELLGYKS